MLSAFLLNSLCAALNSNTQIKKVQKNTHKNFNNSTKMVCILIYDMGFFLLATSKWLNDMKKNISKPAAVHNCKQSIRMYHIKIRMGRQLLL